MLDPWSLDVGPSSVKRTKHAEPMEDRRWAYAFGFLPGHFGPSGLELVVYFKFATKELNPRVCACELSGKGKQIRVPMYGA